MKCIEIDSTNTIDNIQLKGLRAMKNGDEKLSAIYYMEGLKKSQLVGDESKTNEFRKLLLMLL